MKTEIKNNILADKGETLLAQKHPASVEIQAQLEHLQGTWRRLLYESGNRGRGLEEAQDILEFNNQVEEIEAWIRDKEMMVQAGDTGKDYEHCLSIQRKLNDFDCGMRVDDSRIKTINALADKLMKQVRGNSLLPLRFNGVFLLFIFLCFLGSRQRNQGHPKSSGRVQQ